MSLFCIQPLLTLPPSARPSDMSLFDKIWDKNIDANSILDYDSLRHIYNNAFACMHLDGATAEIGVYKGYTSKVIAMLSNKTHYCYDTFEGIIGSAENCGDIHNNGDFLCSLDEVKSNINLDNVIYRKGYFPNTFQEADCKFCFVYSDTATYAGAKATFEIFCANMVVGGKIVFYVDDNCIGVKHAIHEFAYTDDFVVSIENDNLVLFTKT